MRDGFERVGLQGIVAIAQPGNVASIGVMRKLGMQFERMTESRGVMVAMYRRAALAVAGGAAYPTKAVRE
jgi:RimJ/RimL family protein N-acetyltransferase